MESVLRQTHRPIEIIISDDGSTDETAGLADSLARDHPDAIRVVHNPKRGAGPAREAGRQVARGEFIQYLDSDDLLAPEKFAVQVRALRANTECGVAYGRSRYATLDGTVLADPWRWTGRVIPELFPSLLMYRWWCTHTPLYRRSVSDAVGPWSDLRYSQDWEYDARVGALNTKLVYCDSIVGEQRAHQGARQTGTGLWLEPKDRLRFFSLLYRHAVRAGVSAEAAEMKHFSRWVFYHARDCAAAGDAEAAQGCFELSLEASGRPGWDLRLYGIASRALGWRSAGRISRWLVSATGRRPGKFTQTLSDGGRARSVSESHAR